MARSRKHFNILKTLTVIPEQIEAANELNNKNTKQLNILQSREETVKIALILKH